MTPSGDFALAPGPHALLGLWADQGPATVLAFSADEHRSRRDGEPRWLVELPDDGDAGRAVLDRAQQGLRRAEVGLAHAPGRVAGWLDDSRSSDAVAALTAVGPRGVQQPPEAAEAVTVLTRSCTPTALVETRSADRVLGRSRLALGGAVTSVVVADSRAAVDRHEQAVLLAAASRASVLRTTALTVRAAVAIATRFALPGGPLLALPLAWSLVQQVMTSDVRVAGGRRA